MLNRCILECSENCIECEIQNNLIECNSCEEGYLLKDNICSENICISIECEKCKTDFDEFCLNNCYECPKENNCSNH